MNPPSFITINLPHPGYIPPHYYYGYFYAPNTLVIDKDGERIFIGAVGIDLSDENGLIMFKLYRCELTSREVEKCKLLREDVITEDFLSYTLHHPMRYRFVLLDNGDSFILVYANAALKVEGKFRDFGKVLSFYRIPKDPQQPIQRLGSITLPNLVNDSRIVKLIVKKVTSDTTYFFIVRQAGLESTEAHLFSFTGNYNDLANPANWKHEGRIFFQTPSSLSQDRCPNTEDLTPTFMANIGHMSREGYITLWAHHHCPRRLLNDKEIRIAVVLFDPVEKKFYNIRGEPVEHVDLGEPEGQQSNAIISIPLPEQFRNSVAQAVMGQVIVGEKTVLATVTLAIASSDDDRAYYNWALLLEIDRESMKLKNIRVSHNDYLLALQGILSRCHLLMTKEEDWITKFVAFNMENNSFSEIVSVGSYYNVATTMAHISDIIHVPIHSLHLHVAGGMLLLFPDNFHKEVRRPIRVLAQAGFANINVNIEFLKPPNRAAVELLDESGKVEWREIIQNPGQTVNLSILLRNIGAGQKRVRVESLVED